MEKEQSHKQTPPGLLPSTQSPKEAAAPLPSPSSERIIFSLEDLSLLMLFDQFYLASAFCSFSCDLVFCS